ncbi:MAG: class F sortase [Thermomicrobium sp.]
MRYGVSLAVLVLAAWVLGMGAGLLGALTLGGDHVDQLTPSVRRVVRVSPTVAPQLASPTVVREPTPFPTPTAAVVPIARIRIPAIGVDAPVVVKGLDAARRMMAPDSPGEVAWYDFTALPGQGGNIVLAGHVDFVGVGPAVFWDLWRLRVGEVVELELADGRVARYRVAGLETVEETRAPVERIVGPTPEERLTLITCAGNYNPATGRYDQRLIVTAVPVGGPEPTIR